MKNRRFEEIPAELRQGWEPTPEGQAWVELLGPHVPEDVRRFAPTGDGGILISSARPLLDADNSFAEAIALAHSAKVMEPVLQVLTSAYFLAEVPGEGDCLMFFCVRGGETAEVAGWNHETGELYGPLAYDLPTVLRLAAVADSSDDVEQRRAALAPCLGRWRREAFPLSLFEDALADDGVWSRDGDWPEVEAPTSSFAAIVHRAWWVAQALVDAPPDVERIKAALDMTPDKALARDDFQDGPYAALYWLWRSYFLGEDAWHQAVLARCKTSRSRLVRDAAAYAEAGTEALARMRAHVMGVAEHLRNPFPDRVPVGPLALVRDDSLATLEPPARAAPTFACAPGQALNASWQPTPRLAVPHPDGRRWLVDGGHDHPRKGKHPSIPSHVDALYEVDPATGQGTLFCDVPSEAYYIKWAEYLDDDHLLLINNGRLRLYHRIPAGTGRGYLIDQVPLGQEQALVMCGGSLVMGYGGVPRMLDKGWETVAERISGARVEDGRLRRTADVELGLAYIADHDGVLVGRDAGKTVGYRLEGLAASPPVTTIVLKPTAFVVPEKVWRAGPNAVLDALGPQDVCVESAAGLCLINKLVADPPGARRAYVGDGDGIRPTEPEIAIANYALVSPTVALVGNATEAFRVDLATGAATKLFEYPSGVSPEVVGDGFVVIAGADLVAYDGAGAETARVKVGDGAQLRSPLFGHRVVAMKTSTSPFALITLRDGALVLLGAVRPDGPLAGATYAYHSLPQWAYHALVKAADGTMLDLRGVDAALADPGYGLRLDGDLPARPWQAAPEITRG